MEEENQAGQDGKKKISEESKPKKKKRLFKNVKGFKRFLLFFGIILFLVLLFLSISAELTSRPSFCPTCHYMQTFYDSWKASKHHDVDCVECHFEPGLTGVIKGKLNGLVQIVNYMSASYKKRKPWADIPDNTCTRSGCHERQAILDTNYYVKGIQFNHKHHLQELRRGKTLKCISCHSQIVQGTHMEVTYTTCFNCHFKRSDDSSHQFDKLSQCTTCHNLKSKTGAELSAMRYNHQNVVLNDIPCQSCHDNVIQGNGNVGKERCFQCHFEESRLEKYSDIKFMHETHITKHSMKCFTCHDIIEHKVEKVDPTKPPDCLSCHSGAHSSQMSLYSGENGFGTDKMPNIMYLNGINCKGCHVFHIVDSKGITTSKSSPESCNKCHGKGYDKLVTQWESSTSKKLSSIKSIYNIAAAQLKNSRSENSKDANELLAQASHNIKIVENGKSVHNVAFADKLLQASYSLMTQALAKIGSNAKLPVFKSDTEFVPNECYNCHAGIQNKTGSIFGMKYSHNTHVVGQKLTCDRCHSNAKKHGELIITKQECSSCHHSQNKNSESCSKCHGLQASLYNGTYRNLNQPDFMKQADVKCTDCHLSANNIVKPDNQICQKCHKPEYSSMVSDWRSDITGLTKDVQGLLSSAKSKNLNSAQKSLVDETKRLISQLNSNPGIFIHNYDLLSTVLSDFKKKLSEIK